MLQPASPPATPDMSGDKPKEEQTSEIYDAMNWTLLQVEEWLNDKIFQKDMFLSTRYVSVLIVCYFTYFSQLILFLMLNMVYIYTSTCV